LLATESNKHDANEGSVHPLFENISVVNSGL